MQVRVLSTGTTMITLPTIPEDGRVAEVLQKKEKDEFVGKDHYYIVMHTHNEQLAMYMSEVIKKNMENLGEVRQGRMPE